MGRLKSKMCTKQELIIFIFKKESGINIRPVVTSLNPIYDHYNFVNELYIFFIIISHVLDQVSDNTV